MRPDLLKLESGRNVFYKYRCFSLLRGLSPCFTLPSNPMQIFARLYSEASGV